MVKCLHGKRFRVSDKIPFSIHQPAKCGLIARRMLKIADNFINLLGDRQQFHFSPAVTHNLSVHRMAIADRRIMRRES